MEIKPTQESLDLAKYICKEINNLTFHLHYHILYDIAKTFKRPIKYLEIGCYGGGSASLMLQIPGNKVVSIDLGGPIPMETALENVNKLNKHNNEFTYIKGDSHDEKILEKAYNEFNRRPVDILFIDGDHSFNGVIDDFSMYSRLVADRGYVVFDDYGDHKYSPEVKPAVDTIVKLGTTLNIIGQLPNILDAPSLSKDNTLNNCFVVKIDRY